jgi:hypothetical protein
MGITFQEWADKLDLIAGTLPEIEKKLAVSPWYCDGCGQLMYGILHIRGHNYPSPFGTPAGMFISKEYPHVCQLCWGMFHAVNDTPSGYWHALAASDTKKHKRLGRGGDYFKE